MRVLDGWPARVLVVDDDRAAAALMGRVLTRAGFEVETSHDGPAALAAAERFGPDACVLDINMPGMDGYELARRLRGRLPGRPPVLAALTGNGGCEHLDRAAAAGFDLHFSKPADPAEVVEQLDDCVRRGAKKRPIVKRLLARFVRWRRRPSPGGPGGPGAHPPSR